MSSYRTRAVVFGRLGRPWVALGLSIMLLVGCGIVASPTPTPEPVQIAFAFSADLAETYDELIEAFNEEHPHITVERKTARSPDTWSYLFREKQVDAFVFSTEDDLFYDVHKEGGILSLTPLIQEGDALDLNDFYPALLEPFSIDGSVWAIPAGVNFGVMYYNVDLFDQYNAAYPQAEWTWDDLLQAALAVRDVDENVYGFVTFPFFSIPFIYQHGGRILDDPRTPTRTTFDDLLTIEAIEWYASLIHDYDVMPSPQEARKLFGNDGNAAYIFWRGKAGMYMGFFSDRGGESWGPGARWPMRWGMVPLPTDAQAATLGFVLGYAISADTEYPEACWEWLMFLNEQMPPYMMPARRSLAESEIYEARVGPEVAAVARSSIENALIASELPSMLEQDLAGYMEAVEGIMNGDVTAVQALTELQLRAETR
jgi:multiple sugar transport system substrate-binding protein